MIVDFGLSVFVDDEDYGFYSCGTPGYISPETFRMKRGDKTSVLSDVFSAGVVFHILLTGKYLFSGNSPLEVLKNNKEVVIDFNAPHYRRIDPVAFDLLRRMVEKDPLKRLSPFECLCHEFLRE